MSVKQQKLEIGQEVFFQRKQAYSRTPSKRLQSSTVVQIGRKWCYLADRSRVDIDTLCLYVGENEYGRVFLSVEEYEKESQRKELWETLRKECSRVGDKYAVLDSFSQEGYLVVENMCICHRNMRICTILRQVLQGG